MTTKIVKTNVLHEQLIAAQGGINGGNYQLWVECPDDYDVALITATDIVHDEQIRVVDEPSSIRPIELDSWYEHTDGTFGFYVGAAHAGGPTMTAFAATAEECVKRDESGHVYEIGWPARAQDEAVRS